LSGRTVDVLDAAHRHIAARTIVVSDSSPAGLAVKVSSTAIPSENNTAVQGQILQLNG
jgi:hypothetical protein